MDFTRTDIKNLYGDILFTIPEEGKEIAGAKPGLAPSIALTKTTEVEVPVVVSVPKEKPAPLPVEPLPVKVAAPTPNVEVIIMPAVSSTPASRIAWKLRPTSRYALVLHESEFGRKLLTSALKAFVEAAKIPTEQIGFGVIPDASTAWDFSDTPATILAVVMLTPKPAQAHTMPAGKGLFFSDRIVAAVNDTAKERELAAILAKLVG